MRPDRPPGRERESGPAAKPGRPIATSPVVTHTVASSGDDIGRQRAAVLALSDERDIWLARVYRTWREAYALGRARGYDRGYVDGIAARKHAQHLLVDVIGTHLYRWDGLRRDYGKPRPGDYAGGPVDFYGGRRS
jgi:hypothetical protein